MPNPTSYSWSLTGAAPVISSVTVIDAFAVRVVFSEGMNPLEAVLTANYSFTGGLVASEIVRESDTTYRVATSEQSPGATYTLTVSNVHSLVGVLI